MALTYPSIENTINLELFADIKLDLFLNLEAFLIGTMKLLRHVVCVLLFSCTPTQLTSGVVAASRLCQQRGSWDAWVWWSRRRCVSLHIHSLHLNCCSPSTCCAPQLSNLAKILYDLISYFMSLFCLQGLRMKCSLTISFCRFQEYCMTWRRIGMAQ